MSIISPNLNRLLHFYLSGPMPCPYLHGQIERKLFTRLTGDTGTDAEVNSGLTRGGFRRSHDIVYRPACAQCQACVPVRVVTDVFAPDRTQRKIAARNRDLTLEIGPPQPAVELYDLFRRYQKVRHADSDMARMSFSDFAAMLGEGAGQMRLFQLRDPQNVLRGVMLADRVADGFSAVYSFFDPVEPRRSLGTVLVLRLIEQAQAEALPYVYLGYWIRESRKMAYKASFRPVQALGPQGWSLLPEG